MTPIIKISFCIIFCAIQFFVQAQQMPYSVANAHSHNDYLQQHPFYAAYQNGFGSMEVDVHLANRDLLVAHSAKNLDVNETLEVLYLIPLSKIKKTSHSLQLLIDIKTAPIATLEALISILKKYPSIIENEDIRIVISGNRPDESAYTNYPSFIWFDGRLEKSYTTEQLEKIALISDDYGRFTSRMKKERMSHAARDKIIAAIEKAHVMRKPVRLWGSPDVPAVWAELQQLQVDYINTDQIEALAAYLKTK
jgi:alkaline phosphatase